jgi:hypothetical protein
MLTAHPAHDGEEPGFKRTRRLIGMSRPIHGNHSFLTDVLDLGIISQATPQETGNNWSDLLKQLLKGISVTPLGQFHELCPSHPFPIIEGH